MFKNLITKRYQSNIANFQNSGIPGLFSKEGLNLAYFDRVKYHESQLSKATEEKKFRNELDVESYVHTTANDPIHKDIFKHASSLYNLQFAYNKLGSNRSQDLNIIKPTNESLLSNPNINENITNSPQGQLLTSIENSFGSLQEFKTLLLQSASSINGDGFTWLIGKVNKSDKPIAEKPQIRELFILNTYNAGSPRNFNSGQITKLKTIINKDQPKKEESIMIDPILSLEEIEQYSTSKSNYLPFLAIDASPKAYLKDFGVFGKKLYLERLWNSIDWDSLNNDLNKYIKHSKSYKL
ncbi:hypothetical protein WICMUC_004669 [Wickerhamomyces mucosus]|uniref:Manganese/iron superoxide dismutase C-terminal domain-containing protein n=1 Tax=Wickerhamomyces mucosus TaxID=1378264 RepID=A0A9P8PG14_9ASCO|nr:hypothetical protein WICMUC_004669 [Wickerhamomyces mucosus]